MALIITLRVWCLWLEHDQTWNSMSSRATLLGRRRWRRWHIEVRMIPKNNFPISYQILTNPKSIPRSCDTWDTMGTDCNSKTHQIRIFIFIGSPFASFDASPDGFRLAHHNSNKHCANLAVEKTSRSRDGVPYCLSYKWIKMYTKVQCGQSANCISFAISKAHW